MRHYRSDVVLELLESTHDAGNGLSIPGFKLGDWSGLSDGARKCNGGETEDSEEGEENLREQHCERLVRRLGKAEIARVGLNSWKRALLRCRQERWVFQAQLDSYLYLYECTVRSLYDDKNSSQGKDVSSVKTSLKDGVD